LTPYGLEQVTATASLLVGCDKLIDPARLHRTYVSPRKRALQTFHCLFNGCDEHSSISIDGNQVSVTEDIAEWDYGDYEGLKVDEIRQLRKDKGLDHESPWNIWRDGCEGGEYDYRSHNT
jgi:broad specificity phosphatase PhoE